MWNVSTSDAAEVHVELVGGSCRLVGLSTEKSQVVVAAVGDVSLMWMRSIGRYLETYLKRVEWETSCFGDRRRTRRGEYVV